MKTSLKSLNIILSVLLFSCCSTEILISDHADLIHDCFVNDTDYPCDVSWDNGWTSPGQSVAPFHMEVKINPGEAFTQSFTYETMNSMNLLFSGINIKVSFGDGSAYVFPETATWMDLAPPQKEQGENKHEHYNRYSLAEIHSLANK